MALRTALFQLSVCGTLLVALPRAHAQLSECDELSETGQKAAKQGKLLSARKALNACRQSGCSKTTREICDAALKSLEPRIPTIVLKVTGAPAADVSVTMDGTDLASRVDGSVIEIDPGTHDFVFTAKDGRSAKVSLSIAETTKNQEVQVTIADAPPKTVVPPPTAATADPPAPGPATSSVSSTAASGDAGSSQRLIGWIVGGAGLALTGVGVGLYASGASSMSAANCPDVEGAPDCGDRFDDRDRYNSGKSTRSIGVGVIVGGVAAMLGGVVLLVTAPTQGKTAVSAQVTAGPTGLFLVGRF